tara:strand:- start:14 stop:577 length:564 start_codon:yes stop_codon:yes gene_type:complete
MAATIRQENWIDEVLDFWFEQLTPKAWYAKDEATDATIHRRFGDIYTRLSKDLPGEATASARGMLAAVIVLDQFPRNMFRGSAHSFGTDDKALKLAESAILRGYDKELSGKECQFLYMPFQHSEDRDVQSRSVAIFSSLGNPKLLEYAQRHRKIIDRFGRFPHRNEVLGRTSSDEEEGFLQEPGSSF